MGRSRIRTVKPDMWEHEKIGRLSRDERLLFVVLITMADDDGRMRALPRQIIGHGYSHDRISERQVEKWLGALDRNRLIVRYGTGREAFISIRGFHKHQRINRRTPSILPPPPGEGDAPADLFSATSHPQLTEASHPEVEVEVDKEPLRGERARGSETENGNGHSRAPAQAPGIVGEVMDILRRCERLSVPDMAEVAVESAIASAPGKDPIVAAHAAVATAADPAWNMTWGPKVLSYELARQAADAKPAETMGQNVMTLDRRCADCGAKVAQGMGAFCDDCSERRASA
jgi:hypothetical protein